MKVIILRNGQHYGPYTLDQINQYLVNNSLTESDLAWYDGCMDWLPLKDVITPATPPPPPNAKSLEITSSISIVEPVGYKVESTIKLPTKRRDLGIKMGLVVGFIALGLMAVMGYSLYTLLKAINPTSDNTHPLVDTDSSAIKLPRTTFTSKPISASVVDLRSDITDWRVGDIQVTFADGETKILTKDEKCDHPFVSGKGDVGWSVWNDLTNDRYHHTSETLRLLLHDGTIKNFKPNSLFIMDWNFADDDSSVIIKSMAHHGPYSLIKYNIVTGEEIGRQDGYLPYEKMADWAQPFSDQKPHSEEKHSLSDASLIGTYYGTNKNGDQMTLKLGPDHLFGIMNITRTDTAPVFGHWKIDTSSQNPFVSLLTSDETTEIMDEFPDAEHPGILIDSFNNVFTKANSTTAAADTPSQSDSSAPSSDASAKMVLSPSGDALIPESQSPDFNVADTIGLSEVIGKWSGYYVPRFDGSQESQTKTKRIIIIFAVDSDNQGIYQLFVEYGDKKHNPTQDLDVTGHWSMETNNKARVSLGYQATSTFDGSEVSVGGTCAFLKNGDMGMDLTCLSPQESKTVILYKR